MICKVFPFNEATEYDETYKMIIKKEYTKFWMRKDPHNRISIDFKKLFILMVTPDLEKRYTLE